MKEYNAQDYPLNLGSKIIAPRVSFRRDGEVSFNRAAFELLGLQPADKIVFIEYANALFVVKKENGFELNKYENKRKGKTPTTTLTFKNKQLLFNMLQSFELDFGLTYNCRIKPEQEKIKGYQGAAWQIDLSPYKK